MHKKINNKVKKSKKVIDESKLDKEKDAKDQKLKRKIHDNELKSIQFTSGNSLVEVQQVPISFTTQELLQFTGPVSQTVEQIRIIRDCKPNQYMALIKFKNQLSADEFFTNFNGVQFNSIEPEICKLVYVEKIELINGEDNKSNSLINKTELSMVGVINGEQSTCTFCLENLNNLENNLDNLNNETSAILTVLCGHSFHSNCLMKWPDQYCPLCRCSQTPEHVADNICQECNQHQDSLWLCITCGHVGCGRYLKGHAYIHYKESQHNFAMQVGQNNRVWDYAADNYVNRLLQTNDGKPVEVTGNSNEMNEKLEAVQLEYEYTFQSQRNEYEEKINKLKEQFDEDLKDLKELNHKYEMEIKELKLENESLRKEKEKDLKKINTIELNLKKRENELQEEKDLGKCLLDKQKKVTELYEVIKKKMEDKENEISQLKEEVRDLMFYVEVQNKLNNDDDNGINKDELKEGKISLNDPNQPNTSTHSKNRNKNRKK